jgi:hypothetical protein
VIRICLADRGSSIATVYYLLGRASGEDSLPATVSPGPLSDWQTLFSALAECAATLTGLVFVAVSINLERVINTPGLRGRVSESILQFLQVFFICGAEVVPEQTIGTAAIEILALALLFWSAQAYSTIRYLKMRLDHPKLWLIVRLVQTQVATIPFFVAGILLLAGSAAGFLFLALGIFLSFASGVLGARVLLIEVARRREYDETRIEFDFETARRIF